MGYDALVGNQIVYEEKLNGRSKDFAWKSLSSR